MGETVEPTRKNPLKERISLENGPIAQRLEQGTHNPLVVGSNPTGPKRLTQSLTTPCAYTHDG
jgi:hypothetical protein